MAEQINAQQSFFIMSPAPSPPSHFAHVSRLPTASSLSSQAPGQALMIRRPQLRLGNPLPNERDVHGLHGLSYNWWDSGQDSMIQSGPNFAGASMLR